MEAVPEPELTQRPENLPPGKIAGATHYVDFCTAEATFNKAERRVILDAIRGASEKRFRLHAVLVMPDDVQLLLTPLGIVPGKSFDISPIVEGILADTETRINQRRKGTGQIWDPEFVVRTIGDEEEFSSTWHFMSYVPVLTGLADEPEEYPFFWTDVRPE
jgi:REP element-mobilizing transposase RayT